MIKVIPITKRQRESAQKYTAWLCSDSRDNGMTFGEWLKQGAVEPEPDTTCTTCQGTGLGRYDGAGCWSCGGSGDTKGRDAFGRLIRHYED